MKSLRSQTIRLAKENKDLRDMLLPLLRTAAKPFYPTLINRETSAEELGEYHKSVLAKAVNEYKESTSSIVQAIRSEKRAPTLKEMDILLDSANEADRATKFLASFIEDEIKALASLREQVQSGVSLPSRTVMPRP